MPQLGNPRNPSSQWEEYSKRYSKAALVNSLLRNLFVYPPLATSHAEWPACPADKTKLYGLIAKVPNNDWKSLDLREKGYNRKSTNCIINSGEVKSPQIYYVPEYNFSIRNNNKGLLQSYLDCVIQGYLKQFGEEIATEFFSTTDGWDITIRDDRLNPLYPRHVDLTKSERAFIDHNVKLTKKLMLSQVNNRES